MFASNIFQVFSDGIHYEIQEEIEGPSVVPFLGQFY